MTLSCLSRRSHVGVIKLGPLGVVSLSLCLQTHLDQCCLFSSAFSSFACSAGFLQSLPDRRHLVFVGCLRPLSGSAVRPSCPRSFSRFFCHESFLKFVTCPTKMNGALANDPAGLGWQRRERYRPSLPGAMSGIVRFLK